MWLISTHVTVFEEHQWSKNRKSLKYRILYVDEDHFLYLLNFEYNVSIHTKTLKNRIFPYIFLLPFTIFVNTINNFIEI